MLTFLERSREVQRAANAGHICRQLSLLSAMRTNFSVLWRPFATLKGHFEALRQRAALGTSDRA
jgi:hypothetical protein